MAAPP